MVMGSELALPMLIINLGGEMIYILNQRLTAQKIPNEKSSKVRSEVVSHLLEAGFVNDIFRPQELYSLTSTRQVFDRLAHSSIMKLQKASMDKLFDLMIMGLKHQILCVKHPEEIFAVTMNHLTTMREMVQGTSAESLVMTTIDNLARTYTGLPSYMFNQIRQSLLRFLQDKIIKVSLFLSGNIQLPDGTIILNVSGEAPPGTQMPGSIKKFDRGNVVTQYQLSTAATIGYSENPNYQRIMQGSTCLGLNLYDDARRDELISRLSSQYALQQHQSVSSSNPRRIQEDIQPDSGRRQVALWELDDLAAMISSGEVQSETQINLFGDPVYSGQSSEGYAGVTEVSAVSQNERLQNLMKNLDAEEERKGEDDEEDLLDLIQNIQCENFYNEVQFCVEEQDDFV